MHFSVVIPLYNKQNSIVATLQSVLAQTYTDYEVVIVDDGSTDNSAHVVEEFIREVRGERLEVKDEVNGKAESPADTPSGVPDKVRDFVGCSYTIHSPSIHLIRKSNAGVSSARNEGIRQAKYKYVAFLDGDDYWEPTYLETQSQMLKDFPNAKMWGTAWGMMFGCDKQEGHGVGVPLDYCGMIDANTYFSKKMFLYWTDIVVVDKSIFSEIGMFDERMGCGEDVDLWWRIILHYPVAYTNQCLAYYRQDTENRITLSKPKLQTHFINYIEKYEQYYDKCPDFKRYLQHEVLGHLYKYYRECPSNKDVKRILSHIDFSLQPISYRLRYTFPNFYELIQKVRNK